MRRSEGPRSLNDAFRSAGLENVDKCAPHGVVYAQKDRLKKKNAASYQGTALKKTKTPSDSLNDLTAINYEFKWIITSVTGE